MSLDSGSFMAKLPRTELLNLLPSAVQMTARQLPFVVNCAMTCHKLQGAMCAKLMVSSFWYQSNWPYVALSRVKTLKGLFLRKPLDDTKNYSVDPRLRDMTEVFKQRKAVPDDILLNNS